MEYVKVISALPLIKFQLKLKFHQSMINKIIQLTIATKVINNSEMFDTLYLNVIIMIVLVNLDMV